MNEVNALIWPNKLGIGVMNPADYAKTAKISHDFKVIKKPASKASYRTDLAKKAVANLEEAGARRLRQDWKKAVVVLKARRQVATRRRAPGRLRPARSSPEKGGDVTCRF